MKNYHFKYRIKPNGVINGVVTAEVTIKAHNPEQACKKFRASIGPVNEIEIIWAYEFKPIKPIGSEHISDNISAS